LLCCQLWRNKGFSLVPTREISRYFFYVDIRRLSTRECGRSGCCGISSQLSHTHTHTHTYTSSQTQFCSADNMYLFHAEHAQLSLASHLWTPPTVFLKVFVNGQATSPPYDTRYFWAGLMYSYPFVCLTVKTTIPHEECWWGAHLPYLGLEPVGGQTT